ncbi:hemolysin family protein [Actinoallomurus purpureus]|uniref:hemolysin family protein n=1 Tax=Actinoallomurus purpureus TaxID=478114 RepID=UPI002092C86A|nr:hemolysin family protein [Actinoallomurus purpureus]MCO6005118.1 hemolysin family protein [Actinoallomurus purpureus]
MGVRGVGPFQSWAGGTAMVTALAGVVAILALTAATGYFVAQEFAYISADRAALGAEADRGDKRARRALAVMGRLSFMLSGAQLGITVTALIVGFIAEPATSALIAPALEHAGLSGAQAGGVAVVAGFLLATTVQMVLGELLPKNLSLARAEPVAKALAASTLAYLAAAGPVIRLFDAAAARLVRSFGVEPVEELHHGATLEELSDIIGESRRAGHLPPDLSDLLQRALTFQARTAAEVMVPRPDVVAVSRSTTVVELTDLVARAGHTDYPVWGRDIDDVIGVVGVRELAALDVTDAAGAPGGGPGDDRPVETVMRPALLVPDTLDLRAVTARMREAGQEFAAVVDEYGGLAGILTFEDIAEELVGEIADENDVAEADPTRGEGIWVLNAATRIAQVRDLTGLALPGDAAYDSLSGLVMTRLRRLPRAGDRVEVELDPDHGPPGRAVIEVLGVRRRVARTVRVRTLPLATAAPPDEVSWTR